VLPGTHSKWVLLRDGVVVRLATYMTGELFATLSAHGTLAAMMATDDGDERAFAAGIEQARRRAPLSNALFRVRALVVTGELPAGQVRRYVSGLLVGTEFVAAADADGTPPPRIHVIASDALSALYARAGELFGIDVEVLDPHRVYCAGLSRFFPQG
jgi:2-dehydro-3-deoxygalactonokinase